MTILGLIFDMIGAVILGFQPQLTLWDTGTYPKIIWLNALGWGFIFIGFGLILVSELLHKKGRHKLMDNKIKKIIAREGLIVIGIILFGFLIAYIGDYLNQGSKEYNSFLKVPDGFLVDYKIPSFSQMIDRALSLFFPDKPIVTSFLAGNEFYLNVERVGLILLVLGYPLYVVIRFVVWAFKTLRQK